MASVPRYEKLILLLKEKLTDGQYKIGDRFYSQNELMKKYSLSFATVTRALNELEREGYLLREQGRGTFVRGIPNGSNSPEPQVRRIAVFIPWDARNPAHLNFQRLYRGLEAGRPGHYQLNMIPFSNDPGDLEPFLFSRDHTDGIVFVYPGNQHVPFIDKMAGLYPVVVVGRHVTNERVTSVRSDNAAGAEEAVDHLIQIGHRSIGMISGPMEMTDSPERLEGYRSALKKASIPFRDGLVIYTHPIELNGYSATLDLFDRNTGTEITAIFAAGDIIAMGVIAAARSMGKRIPDDLSLMGFDDIDPAADLDPPLTTIHVPIEELAGKAMELLVAQIGGALPSRADLPARLVTRSSVQPALAGALKS